MSPRLICLYLVVHLRTQTCGGFNIDDRFPVIKEGKTAGSLFGFSVAMHQQTTGPGGTRYLLLTGAPKEKAQSLKNVNETGAVYSCPITLDTADCSRMDLVTKTNPKEMVEGMWLGVTVASQRALQDGRVLACGHRYVKITQSGAEEQRRMIGKCYVRSNDLTFDPDDDWQSYSYEVCNPTFDMDFEGMCNAGISAGMTDTDVYVGSAGSYSWQGNVHVIWRNPDPGNTWDRADYDIGIIRHNRQRYKFSYMGYSVLEEKKLLSRDEYTVVTGSPRNESKGSVVLGTPQSHSNIQLVVSIPGEQVGSYFGNSLAVTDLNNDDWNDLIVGAPYFFDRTKDQGGAVYIFINENGSFQEKATVVLKGPPGSAFGMAVAAIGDVNQDGFQDFAVGAPFHDAGKVYIWMGSKKGISMEPSQVIEGKSVGSGFKTFGYSINGGMDMDDNAYPDILVGSLDDRIALLRARPVVHLTNNFTVEPKIVDPNQCSGKASCIKVTLCMSFTLSNGNKDFKSVINVKFTVEADAGRRKSPRVKFQRNNVHTYTGLLSLPSFPCDTLELDVMGPVKDKLEPVVFSLNVSLLQQNLTQKGAAKPINLDSFPILSLGQKLTQRTEINFQNECGSDNKCSSNLKLSAWFASASEKRYPSQGEYQVLQLSSDVKIIKLMVNVTNNPSDGKLAEDAHQATLNVTIPDALQYSGVRYRGHSVECRFDTTVICDLGNPLKGNDNVSFELNFETSGIDLYTQKTECQLLLSTLSEQSDLKPLPVTLLIENTIAPTFSIIHENVYTQFSGTVMGESAMNQTSDVGSLVEFTFTVDMNKQPLGDLGTLAVEFEWPYEVANGKWLLYLTKIVVKGESEMECNPGGVVNTLNLSESRALRRKRQTAGDESNDGPQVAQTAVIKFLSQRKNYHLDCSMGTARCVTFTCPLRNMTNSATIHVRSRLWNSTMLEDYSNALGVYVKGKATLTLIKNRPSIKMDNTTTTFTVEIKPVMGVETPYELPLWIIVSAVVAGVVLLGIIILILWKCGFFQRASRREMYEAKSQKAEMKIQPSETDKMIEDY